MPNSAEESVPQSGELYNQASHSNQVLAPRFCTASVSERAFDAEGK
jgi:hypothetical protein